MITTKHIICILIIIVIILIILTLYLLYNKSNNKTNSINSENFYNSTDKPVSIMGSPLGPSGPNGICHMTPSDNPTWNSNAKFISIDNKRYPNGVYYFGKNITIIDPTKISSVIMYFVTENKYKLLLNYIQIYQTNTISFSCFTPAGANNIDITNNKYIIGSNRFIFELNQSALYDSWVYLLAQIVITYKDGTTETHQTDSSWIYYGTTMPPAPAQPAQPAQPVIRAPSAPAQPVIRAPPAQPALAPALAPAPAPAPEPAPEQQPIFIPKMLPSVTIMSQTNSSNITPEIMAVKFAIDNNINLINKLYKT